jgi:hypothetical protein
MPAEIPLQVEMFTGTLVDTRTDAQKERDERAAYPKQTFMFSQSELVQIDRPATATRAWQHEANPAPLELVMQDTRSEEEQQREQHAVEISLIAPLFPNIEEIEEASESEIDTATVDATASGSSETATTVGVTLEEALAELERAVSDITQTIAAAPDVLLAQAMWLAHATLDASLAGVARSDIDRCLALLTTSPQPYPIKPLPMAMTHTSRQPSQTRIPTYYANHYPTNRGKREERRRYSLIA